MEEWEFQYRSATGVYQAAFDLLESLQSQYVRHLQAFDSARVVGNEAREREEYTTVLDLAARLGSQEQRVQETADLLEAARASLLEALTLRWEELLQRGDTMQDPEEARAVLTEVIDTENRVEELREAEEPVVTLEPLPDIEITPRDDSTSIRTKAELLDVWADRREEQLAYNERLLEELRREQGLLRRRQDFEADVERFGDTRLPVGPPGARMNPPLDPAQRPAGADSLGVAWVDLTHEERIAALLAFHERETARIEEIRAKAVRFRRLAGGEWA